jgi:hypothetical protein
MSHSILPTIAAAITARRNDHGMLPDILAAIASKYHEHSRRVCQAWVAPSRPGRRTHPKPRHLLRGGGAFFVPAPYAISMTSRLSRAGHANLHLLIPMFAGVIAAFCATLRRGQSLVAARDRSFQSLPCFCQL